MSIQVKISKGLYRGKPVEGTFKMVKPYNAAASFITVFNPNPEPGTPNNQRIQCQPEDFQLLDAEGEELGEHVVVDNGVQGQGIVVSSNYEQVFVAAETEDEAMERISGTFAMLDKIVDGCAKEGGIRGLVVSGPPGIGKSFGVEKQLEVANMFRTIKGMDPKYEFVTGGVSSIGLYQKLYYNRHPENVLVFDDCDGILFEEESLSLLKGALNSGDKRRICWNKQSRVLNTDDIPDAFDFEASIIFLSNVDFERTIAKGSRISSHLEAIMSRCHYMDLEIGSTRDKILRIKQIIRDGMLKPYNFTDEQEADVLNFMLNNAEYLRELSLRMVKKVADFVKTDPHDWLEMAEATLLTRDAKFKRLVEKRNTEAAKRGLVLAEKV
jgi:hypothetical protein